MDNGSDPLNAPSPREFITDRLAIFVESTGFEMGVTLLVGGTRIYGTLAPVARYQQWVSDSIAIVSQAGKVTAGGYADSPSETEMERTRAAFKARLEELDSANGHHRGRPTFPWICLRNANVQTGVGAYHSTHSFLLVSASQVGAVSLGAIEVTPEFYGSDAE